MSVLQFIASLVRSLAWPTIVLLTVVILRRPLSDALRGGLSRLKVGPFEAEWRTVAAVTREQAARGAAAAQPTPPQDEQPPPGQLFPESSGDLIEDLRRLAVTSPRAAVMQAYGLLERELRDLTIAVDPEAAHRFGASGVAALAHCHRLISDATRQAVDGLSVMRNLATHDDASTGRLDTAKALEFIDLVAATLFAVRFEQGKSMKAG